MERKISDKIKWKILEEISKLYEKIEWKWEKIDSEDTKCLSQSPQWI